MTELSRARIQEYRAGTYRLKPGGRIKTQEEAVAFVNERGYIYFWPVKGVELPSLWAAVAGDRPVADEHDDPGHVTWGWKDGMLGTRRWYYAKVLRKRATMISLAVAPYFYALSENYGAPEEDYLLQYQEGRMTWEAKTVYETLLAEGPLDTVSLRQMARMTSQASNSPFARALDSLQADFKILPVGVAQAGAWKYAFIYDLVHRHYPNLAEEAHAIRQTEARRTLAELYMRSVGAAQARDLMRLFGWTPPDTERALAALTESGLIAVGLTVKEQPGEWIALAELV
jgi:DNA glycosylase AlkZ-like